MVDDVLIVASWMGADAMGVPDPSPEKARGSLSRSLAEQEAHGEADCGTPEGSDHDT